MWRRVPLDYVEPEYEVGGNTEVIPQGEVFRGTITTCLLYTSDAADE